MLGWGNAGQRRRCVGGKIRLFQRLYRTGAPVGKPPGKCPRRHPNSWSDVEELDNACQPRYIGSRVVVLRLRL